MATEKYLVRHFLSIQQFLEDEELDNVYWLPATENPADGCGEGKSEMLPTLALLNPKSECFTAHGVSSCDPSE